ncbi:MAG: metallophosphoesterase [Sphingomonas sp.]|nr:metallophosphoesterase [Sphingomonas sp.]
MLLAQITDLHLGFDADDPDEFNRQRFDQALRVLIELNPLPDLLIVTGDIADDGDDRVSYARYREAIAGLPFPVYSAMGNHDSRDAFLAAFPDAPHAGDGFIQYVIEGHDLRIVVLDTLEPGRHGGAFCAARAAWLRARLAEAPDRPTLIVLHHPPIDTGIGWLTEDPESAWAKRVLGAVEGFGNVVGYISGHVHRAIVAQWAGRPLVVCPSTAPQVALDLTPIDPERPDARPMIIADHPYYALHWWNGEALVSHIDTAEDHEVLARYTPDLQPLVRLVTDEQKDA